MTKYHNHTLTAARPKKTGLHREDSTTAQSQLLFEFDAPGTGPTTTTLVDDHELSTQFALRFAALLEVEPSSRFDNRAIAELAVLQRHGRHRSPPHGPL